jgi:carboxypeptidase Q
VNRAKYVSKTSCTAIGLISCAFSWAFAQGPTVKDAIAPEIASAIRREADRNSQIPTLVHSIADRYGARLTGSPNHEAAASWAAATLKAMGLENSRLEPWNFGHSGWSNREASGYLVSPFRARLTFEVLAWTPSTDGTVTGAAVQIVPLRMPTREQLSDWLSRNREQVRGKIVLVGRAARIQIAMNPPPKRFDYADLRAHLSASDVPDSSPPAPPGATLTNLETLETVNRWLKSSGALLRVEDSGRPLGQVRAQGNPTWETADTAPTVVLRNEDFGRIERLLADGENVRLQFNLQNVEYPSGRTSHNVIAEIPGRDKPDEVVMFGAHLDSWHAATGATDNAVGCAITMEAAHILATLPTHPKRTVRIALWSGEEQGNLGSKAYVATHFGAVEQPKAEFPKLSAYLNIDRGTGRIRGLWLFGPSSAADAVQSALSPFEDLGFVFAAPSPLRAPGNSDHSAFTEAGLPAGDFVQDPIDYSSTWHTQLDTYERILPGDAKEAASLIALAVWDLAEREELLPRYTAERMPKKLSHER